jgi:hypothetical protein
MMRFARTWIRCISVTIVAVQSAAAWADESPDLWSLQPLTRPAAPAANDDWVCTPVDAFILATLQETDLTPSPPADRRTLIRRLTYDLIGLPPTPAETEAFLADTAPDAYLRLVNRLLDSPHYGERWGRHWLDVVHYGDTHGYDKDKPRPNAWPYRDYVIRAFNEDKPYRRFVREQLAGDVLFPGQPDGIEATGFIAAGPWDFIGHAEVPETKIDGRIARHLDRDDMVTTTMNTFLSLTVQCARCHDHKFDPVSMDDYYSLQAVFAALDRADRLYDTDPNVARQRTAILQRKSDLEARHQALDAEIQKRGGEKLAQLDRRIAALTKRSDRVKTDAFGYHSEIEPRDNVPKWVQVDLGVPTDIGEVVYTGCHDDFNGIGAGFGFPVRYKIEISDDPTFAEHVTLIAEHTQNDVPNPGTQPQHVTLQDQRARFVRVTATQLAPRRNDFIFALAELQVLDRDGENVAAGAKVTALDSIEAPARWQRANLVDGYYYGVKKTAKPTRQLAALQVERKAVLDRVTDDALRQESDTVARGLKEVDAAIAGLPRQRVVYAGTVHTGDGAFRGTGHDGGRPRVIHVLNRGDIRTPAQEIGPGTLGIIPGAASRFDLPAAHPEGRRRAALADWIVDVRNPLTWRSIVNRVWQYHFGRGLVDTPNDFGHMGDRPTHPELLDWLAIEFRDGGQSFKALHRLIVTSAVYRQSSAGDTHAETIDAGNRYLWRMNRRRLDAESIRDGVLAVSGKLDPTLFGPAFQDFVIEKPEHSPHYQYHLHDPDDPRSHRRSIYRFLVRSQPQPFMQTLDCADPSEIIAKRNETLTALQALALLNNRFMVRMSEHLAARLQAEHQDLPSQLKAAYVLTVNRSPTRDETHALTEYADEFGLANACRVILNLNEFVFVD